MLVSEVGEWYFWIFAAKWSEVYRPYKSIALSENLGLQDWHNIRMAWRAPGQAQGMEVKQMLVPEFSSFEIHAYQSKVFMCFEK